MTPYFNSLPPATQARLRPLLPTIVAAAQREGVSPDLLLSLAQEESAGNANAVGDAGKAKGMYQVQDAKFWLGGADPFDPVKATDAISKRVAEVSRSCNGDPACVHFKFNAGPGQKYTPQNVAAINAKFPHVAPRLQRVATALGSNLVIPGASAPAPVQPLMALPAPAPFDPLAAPVAAARKTTKTNATAAPVDPLAALWGGLVSPSPSRRGRVNSDPIVAMLGLT